MKILLVEDQENIINELLNIFSQYNYIVDVVRDGELGWKYSTAFEYDLIIIDIITPKIDGISLCKKLRTEGYFTPILLLTEQGSLTAKINGLDAGADDYLVQPYHQAELISRIRALIRRCSTSPLPILSWENLLLNQSTCEVNYDELPLKLTNTEYELLALLMRDSQHVFSCEELIDRLWSSEDFPSPATVRSHIRRLRQKLSEAGAPKDLISTVHGRGYYLKPLIDNINNRDIPHRNSKENNNEVIIVNKSAILEPESVNAKNKYPKSSYVYQEYLNYLNELWSKEKQGYMNSIEKLSQSILSLNSFKDKGKNTTNILNIYHQLIGAFGIFGLSYAMRILNNCKNIIISESTPFNDSIYLEIHESLTQLKQHLSNNKIIENNANFNSYLKLFIVTNKAINHGQRIIQLGIELRVIIHFIILSDEGCGNDITSGVDQSKPEINILSPDVVLILLSDKLAISNNENLSIIDNKNVIDIYNFFVNSHPFVEFYISSEFKVRQIYKLKKQKDIFTIVDTSIFSQLTPAITQIAELLDHLKEVHVIIIDSDEDWLCSIPNVIKQKGYTATTLADDSQFWTVLEVIHPDALIIEYKSPQIDSTEICRLIRNHPYWNYLPILLLVDGLKVENQNLLYQVGADDILFKPISSNELANRISHRLKRMQDYAERFRLYANYFS
ncbi:response regulator transcription factor [Acaryochloris marina]|uniref:Two-component response regulator n=1 Tax=Acaryochloris marina (strain MBIC 11017) TaxID=329726 RepID=A8ZMZ0_ACAM1|nr:response regulator [Acaryochloris marina]ABW32189.1 two-component response regulator [Acaryochloris marina MBIC11017]